MQKSSAYIGLVVLLFCSVMSFNSCVTTKSAEEEEEVSKFGKFMQNTTSKFNYHYNANLLLEEAFISMDDQQPDNYNKTLDIFKYVTAPDTASISGDMQNVIEKHAVSVNLHRQADWSDDSYLGVAKAQFLLKQYENAENTLLYALEEYNPVTLEEEGKSTEEKVVDKEKERSQAIKESNRNRKKKKNRSSKKKVSREERAAELAKAEEKAKKEKEKEVTKNQEKPDTYFMKHRPVYQEMQLWLAKSYLERGKIGPAEQILYKLLSDSKTFKDIRTELYPVMAYAQLVKREFTNESLRYLEQSIEESKKKDKKARYTFILAQVLESLGENAAAAQRYTEVEKLNPDYEMVFNSKLNQNLLSFNTGSTSKDEIIKSLDRMAKDFKNEEYRDQIYFALGNIAMDQKDLEGAIGYYKESLKYNVSNQVQKAESYLSLADIYFNAEDFVPAKNYYDSTLTVLAQTDERFDIVENYAANLEIIAKNIEIITLQDSLLAIAAMSEDDRAALAQSIIKERKKQQVLANLATANASQTSNTNIPVLHDSDFFAYDSKRVKKGERDFQKMWGSRVLEDNWRRSNKSSFTDTAISQSDSTTTQLIVSDSDISDVFKDVPLTDEQKKAAYGKIENALFALGKSFREDLQNDLKSIESLEELNRRFEKNSYQKESYYYLYLAYKNIGNKLKADEYYNKILNEFPKSSFALILTDPDYAKKLLEKEAQLISFYDDTYQIFQKGNAPGAKKKVDEANLLFGKGNVLAAKFAILNAMCLGKIDGKPAYVKALREVIAKYPDTAEKIKAEEMLRVLIGARYDSGRKTAAAPDRGLDQNEGKFTLETDKLHYVIIVYKDQKLSLDEAKLKIAEFNKFHFKESRLRVTNLFLDPEAKVPIIVVRKFADMKVAMTYYDNTVDKKASFLGNNIDYEIFPVTQNNYRQILRSRSLDGYRDFFSGNYTK